MNTSTAQYRKHECYYCHALKPANEMHKKTVEEKSGRTSWGLSFNPARKKSGRIYTGKTHYKTREVWVCDSCVRTRSSLSFMAASAGNWAARTFLKVIIGIVIVITLLVMCIHGKNKSEPRENRTEPVQVPNQGQEPVQQKTSSIEEEKKPSSLNNLIDKLKQNASKTKSAHFDNDEPEYLK